MVNHKNRPAEPVTHKKTSADAAPTEGPAADASALRSLLTVLFGGTGGALTLAPPNDLPALAVGVSIACAALAWLLAWMVAGPTKSAEQERRRRRRLIPAFLLSGIALLASVLCFVDAHSHRTAVCGGQRHVVGTELTDAGKKLVARRGYGTAEELLMAAGCKESDVWTAPSLQWSERVLWTTFLLLIGAVTLPVILLWYSRSGGKEPSAAPTRPPHP